MQMLWNFYCNAYVNFGDGTCCGMPEELSTMQMIAFTVYFLWLTSL